MLKSEENMGELGIKIIKLHQWMEFSMDFSWIFSGENPRGTLGKSDVWWFSKVCSS